MKFTFTFNQLAAVVISTICIAILSFKKLDPNSADAIKAVLGLASFYLFGSTVGSQKKDEAATDTANKMVDALANSTPSPKNV